MMIEHTDPLSFAKTAKAYNSPDRQLNLVYAETAAYILAKKYQSKHGKAHRDEMIKMLLELKAKYPKSVVIKGKSEQFCKQDNFKLNKSASIDSAQPASIEPLAKAPVPASVAPLPMASMASRR